MDRRQNEELDKYNVGLFSDVKDFATLDIMLCLHSVVFNKEILSYETWLGLNT